jgi:hypothetical protein
LQTAAVVWGVKWGLQTFFAALGIIVLRQYSLLPYLLVFDFFAAATGWYIWLAYLYNASVTWKGILYDKNEKVIAIKSTPNRFV